MWSLQSAIRKAKKEAAKAEKQERKATKRAIAKAKKGSSRPSSGEQLIVESSFEPSVAEQDEIAVWTSSATPIHFDTEGEHPLAISCVARLCFDCLTPSTLNEALTHTACCGVGCTEGPEGAEDGTVVEVDVFPIPDAYIAEVYERFNDGSAASGTKLTDMLEDTGILMDSTVEAAVLAFYELHGCVNNCWCRWILF